MGIHDAILLRMAFRLLILAMVDPSPALNPTSHAPSLPGIHHIYKTHKKHTMDVTQRSGVYSTITPVQTTRKKKTTAVRVFLPNVGPTFCCQGLSSKERYAGSGMPFRGAFGLWYASQYASMEFNMAVCVFPFTFSGRSWIETQGGLGERGV